jgi:hypothetical protein
MANRRSGAKKKHKRDNYKVRGMYTTTALYSSDKKSTRGILKAELRKELDMVAEAKE